MSKKLFTTDAILPAQIEDWKNETKLTGGVFAFSIPVSEQEEAEKVTGYFKKPTIDEMALVSSSTNKNTGVKAIYKTCLLGGHPSFQIDTEGVTDEEIVKAALKEFQKLLKTRDAEVKKL